MTEPQPVILLVEDQEANRYVVRRILERSGYRVVEAETGGEALRLAHERPDLIVLDIQLPDMSGFEVCRQLKADPELRHIPVLNMSANFTRGEDKVQGLESGADAYLVQPLEPGVLIATVRALLRMRSAEISAREAIRARDRILGVVSHDLRNPLMAINLRAELILRLLQAPAADLRVIGDQARSLRDLSLKMARMISDLTQFSHLESTGKLSLELAPHAAVGLVDEAFEMFEVMAGEKGVLLQREAITLSGRQVYCDRDRILQVFSNLLGNALRFTPAGGRVDLTAAADPHGVRFSVIDTGPGIAPELLSRIFEPYVQASAASNPGGMGLGLAISRGIVEAHGGEIKVESSPGKGAAFHFTLPVAS